MAVTVPPTPPRERNPITTKRHRQEVFRQITLPVVIGSLVLVLFSVLVVFGSMEELSRWADISLIWLIIPAFFFAFIFMVFFAGLTYLTVRAIISLPIFSFMALNQMRRLSSAVLKFSNMLTEPFLKYEGTKAAGKAAVRGLRISRNGSTERQTDG